MLSFVSSVACAKKLQIGSIFMYSILELFIFLYIPIIRWFQSSTFVFKTYLNFGFNL